MRRAFLQSMIALAASPVLPAAAQAYEARPWPAGAATPDMQATDLQGKLWRLADLRGRAVLLNFWATWCEPCRAEMPTLQQLSDISGPDQLVVLTINFKEPAAKASQFAAATGMTLPVLRDPQGEIARRWGVHVFPTTILIGSDGRARQRIRGEVDWTGRDAERMVAPLLRARSRAV